MLKDADGDISLTDNEIIEIIKDDITIDNENNKNIPVQFQGKNSTNKKRSQNNVNTKENDTYETLSNKIEAIFNELFWIKIKTNSIEEKITNLMDTNIISNKNKIITKRNPFDISWNLNKNKNIENKQKSQTESLDQEIIEIGGKNNISNNFKSIRSTFFVFTSMNVEKIEELYKEVINDIEFDNMIILEENRINNDRNYYIFLKFNGRRSLDIKNMTAFKYLNFGKKSVKSLEIIKSYGKIIFDAKEKGVPKELKLKELVK